MEIKLNVRRFDPASGEDARFQSYSVDLPEHATVLDALIQVREYVDGSLAMRCSCRSAICGSCAMRVDHQARLACKTKVIDLTKGKDHEITVEPMGNMPVLKDLVTDMEVHWGKVRQVEPWLMPTGPAPEREYLVPNAAMQELAQTMNCIHCGACVSDCTVLEVDKNFIGPAALAKAYRFAGDPRETRDPNATVHEDRLRKLSEYSGIWDCTRCNMCVEVCPKDVRPMDQIMKLRELAVEEGITDNTGARHGTAFSGSVRRLGRLDEASLLPGSVGFWNVPRLLSELPGGLRMLRVGKLPWKHALPWHKPINGVANVRRIFDKLRREKKEAAK
ncbi:MAG: succinate dehydrogenase iron-sulfur subunit [Dehalococcoidia bacterium]